MDNRIDEKVLQETIKIKETLSRYIEKYNATHEDKKSINNLFINERVNKPGAIGCFNKNNKWYLYEVDDRFNTLINGPFTVEGIVVALAYEIYINAQELQFTEEENLIYLQGNIPEEKFNTIHRM